MHVLITGTSGTIGHALSDLFLRDGCNVSGTFGKKQPKQKHPRLTEYHVSLENFPGTIPAPDFVIHSAAQSLPGAPATLDEYVHSNILGTLGLAEYCAAKSPKAIIYLSTLSVYGKVHEAELTEDTPFDNPEPYGASKYLGELILKDVCPHIPIYSLRLPGVIGKGYTKPWLGHVVKCAATHQPIQVYNPTSKFNNVVDMHELYRFIRHVFDMMAVNNSKQPFATALNMAAHGNDKVIDVINFITRKLKSQSKIVEVQADRSSFSVSIKKLQELGFKPLDTLSIIDRYIEENREIL